MQDALLKLTDPLCISLSKLELLTAALSTCPLLAHLTRHQLGIGPPRRGYESVVAALLHHSAAAKHDDPVRAANGGEPVRHNYHGPARHQRVERQLHSLPRTATSVCSTLADRQERIRNVRPDTSPRMHATFGIGDCYTRSGDTVTVPC